MIQILAVADDEEELGEGSLDVTSIEVLDPTPVNTSGNVQLVNNSNVTDPATGKVRSNTVAAAERTTFALVRSGGEVPTVIEAASTKDFIELNLYDYGSNINDKYDADTNAKKYKLMPGFQWNGGAQLVNNVYTWTKVDCIDFGNSVITDFDWGQKKGVGAAGGTTINGLIEKPTGDYANYPVGTSAGQNILLKTLKDEYPALSNGTSLSYLFKNGTYAIKQNSESIDGLFQYDAETGEYWYRSRENHAQYENNRFTLFEDKITPNFILYPFGNFLPFNKIDDLSVSTHVKEITNGQTYIQGFIDESKALASSLAGTGKATTYNYLYNRLANYRDKYLKTYSGTETAADMASDFFSNGGPADVNFTLNDFQDLYNIDFTEPKNFFFGMEMKMNFMQPKGGLTGKDGETPMVFEFSGDDDVWVYIDDVLFLDLSGIHRHVSGKIDFVNGKVTYYALDPSSGDTGEVAFKTFTFKEILTAAGKDTSVLENNRFKDYTYHDFNFYYMERGSGSSVCEINFNFPLLRRNSISVGKELTVDNGTGKEDLLGDKNFNFQIFKADDAGNKTNQLFVDKNTSYKVYDENGNLVSGTFKTDENGMFTLKPGQRAEFAGIQENSGKYYVRELLDPTEYKQYGTITVSGQSTTIVNNVEVDGTTFKGVDSPVKDASDGISVFQFNNKVTFIDLGKLEISKTLESYTGESASGDQPFTFQVKLNGADLPAGTKYTVAGETKTVETAGEVLVPAGSKAVISNIFLGTTFEVKEKASSSSDYTVTYTLDGAAVSEAVVTGEIRSEGQTVKVNATNKANGIVIDIPIKKTLTNGDGKEHSYKVQLVETDADGNALAGATPEERTITISGSGKCTVLGGAFTKTYVSTETTDGAVFYYELTEVADSSLLDTVAFDPASYIVKVTISKGQNTFDATTTWYKDGVEITADDAKVAEFINTLLGTIRIEKAVVGIAEDPNKEFEFMVSIDRGTLPKSDSSDLIGTFSSYLLEEGNQLVAVGLADKEYIEIKKIPLGTVVTVEERGVEKYDVSWNDAVTVNAANPAKATSTVNSDADNNVLQFTCTNSVKPGDLSITKTVLGNDNWKINSEFDFTVKYQVDENWSDTEFSATYKDTPEGTVRGSKVQFEKQTEGTGTDAVHYAVATVKLCHGETVIIDNLPAGLLVTVQELNHEGYITKWTGSSDTSDEIEVTILCDETVATECTNEYLTKIKIDKIVAGILGDRSKLFDFNVTITDPYGAVINREFSLAHDTKPVIIEGIRVGSSIVVRESETDYEASYTTSAGESGEGFTFNGSMPYVEELTITFTNKKEATIDTGILLDSAPYIATLAIALGGMVIYIISKRRKKEDDME